MKEASGVEDFVSSRRVVCVRDFNAIKKDMESKGKNALFNRGEAYEFNAFIGDMNLIYIPIVSSKFTWGRRNGGEVRLADLIISFL